MTGTHCSVQRSFSWTKLEVFEHQCPVWGHCMSARFKPKLWTRYDQKYNIYEHVNYNLKIKLVLEVCGPWRVRYNLEIALVSLQRGNEVKIKLSGEDLDQKMQNSAKGKTALHAKLKQVSFSFPGYFVLILFLVNRYFMWYFRSRFQPEQLPDQPGWWRRQPLRLSLSSQ